jgi:hypothetical protein
LERSFTSFVFHLLDDQAHHLLGIFCLVEQGRQVGIDDVGQAGKILMIVLLWLAYVVSPLTMATCVPIWNRI